MDISIAISVLALGVSALTAWFTLFRRGDVRMTQPTVVYFGPDGGPRESKRNHNKVFLRSLLFSTAKRGSIVEEMFVRLKRAESQQVFNIWVLGDQHLTRGSGVFVGPEGVATNHHFLLPDDGTSFDFLPGNYLLEVFVRTLGSRAPSLLRSIPLTISEQQSSELQSGDSGLYFDWGPDSQQYHPHLRKAIDPDLSDFLLGMGGRHE